MGKYINSFEGFVNENKLIDLASKYTDVKSLNPATPNDQLMDQIVQKIKSEKGDKIADQFVLSTISSGAAVTEEIEMEEPCEACKAHAKEMKNDN